MANEFTLGDLRGSIAKLLAGPQFHQLLNSDVQALHQIDELLRAQEAAQSDELPDLSKATLEYMVDETKDIRSEKGRLEKLDKYYSGRLKALLDADGKTSADGKKYTVEDVEVRQQRMSQEGVTALLTWIRETLAPWILDPDMAKAHEHVNNLVNLCNACWGQTIMHQLKFRKRTPE